MQKTCLSIIFILFFCVNLNANDINLPPELLWWIFEVKKINPKVEIKDFVFSSKQTIKFNGNFYQRALTYPVFMRWNYSGNTVGYYDYGRTQPKRLPSGKYSIGGDFDDMSTLLIADRKGEVIYGDDFGISEGLNSIYWLTDLVLIGVGISINNNAKIDLLIIKYGINFNNKTVERSAYIYKNAFDNDKRDFIRLNWFEHRTDYFEIIR